ncbi:MAG: cupin domain-containing protein [Candidatus Odinarchaeum yellowstonii]|uniref:Cupin domain-containing protein n=1 Tax=Odinarchaeota yellowstonii (strain LCB_4) TaxID=1841599 RepID=A0AAF0D2C3_ODILC|nr:MAG: cupin domain-containing protein [Candidatus Odinarchaeum yellowstonii]
MYIKKVEDVKAELVAQEGVKGTYIQVLIDKERCGAVNFAMRRFIIKPGGEIGLHNHNWEHEIFVLKGKGIVKNGETTHEVEENTVIYIPPNEPHYYKNTGRTDLVFLCLIPIKN